MQPLQSNNLLVADMSHYQGDAQFTGFDQYGVHAAILKATQGIGYVDPMFPTFVVRARAAGKPFSLYHFAEPSKNSPQAEATHFLTQWNGAAVTPGMYGWLDLEAFCDGMTPDQVTDWVLAFEAAFKATTGRVLGLYSNVGFIQQFGGFNGRLAHMPLWIASFPGANTDKSQFVISDIGGWTDWVMWQFEDTGSIVGVPNAVDMSYCRSLEAIGYEPPVPQFSLPVDQADEMIRFNQEIYKLVGMTGNDNNLHKYNNWLRAASGQPTI